MTLEESQVLLARAVKLRDGWMGAHTLRGGLSSFANCHLIAPTKARILPWAMCQGGHFLQAQMMGGFSAGLNWGPLV